jgi:hypothetical protein
MKFTLNLETRLAAQKEKSHLKQKAAESPHAPPSVILNDFKIKVGMEVHPTLPSDDLMKRSIRRWRAIPGMKNPKTRHEIVLSEAHKNDANGNRFLFRNSGGCDRILIFATNNNLQVGMKCLHLLYCLHDCVSCDSRLRCYDRIPILDFLPNLIAKLFVKFCRS